MTTPPVDHASRSDAELLSLWCDGDGAAGNELARRHYKPLYLAVRRKIGDSGLAEDIVHQAFLLVMKQRDKIREGTKFRGYLHCIAHRQLCERLRQIYRDPEFDPDVLSAAAATGSLSGAVDLRIDTKLLYRALRELPLEHQLTLELYVWEDLTAVQIAELMEVTLAKVRHRIREGKERLERLIDRYRADPRTGADETAELVAWFGRLRDRAQRLLDPEPNGGGR